MAVLIGHRLIACPSPKCICDCSDLSKQGQRLPRPAGMSTCSHDRHHESMTVVPDCPRLLSNLDTGAPHLGSQLWGEA